MTVFVKEKVKKPSVCSQKWLFKIVSGSLESFCFWHKSRVREACFYSFADLWDLYLHPYDSVVWGRGNEKSLGFRFGEFLFRRIFTPLSHIVTKSVFSYMGSSIYAKLSFGKSSCMLFLRYIYSSFLRLSHATRI